MPFGFASRQMPTPTPGSQFNPWGGLPTGGATFGGSPTWQAAQQAPWRMSPWQTQAMPTAAPIAPPPTPAPAPSPFLGQGMSGNIPGFQPGMPGGGFYPQQAAPTPAPAPAAPAAPAAYMGAGQLFSDPFAAQRHHREYSMSGGSAQPLTSADLQQMALLDPESVPLSMLPPGWGGGSLMDALRR